MVKTVGNLFDVFVAGFGVGDFRKYQFCFGGTKGINTAQSLLNGSAANTNYIFQLSKALTDVALRFL
jgi:hypothetical protein